MTSIPPAEPAYTHLPTVVPYTTDVTDPARVIPPHWLDAVQSRTYPPVMVTAGVAVVDKAPADFAEQLTKALRTTVNSAAEPTYI